MKHVRFERTPQTEGITNALGKVDFTDTFATTNQVDDMATISGLVFGTMPPWVSAMMNLRNRMVKVFGLKTEIPEDYNKEFRLGGYIGFFKIMFISQDEVVLGDDDEHLNFRVSIYNSGASAFNIKVTTLLAFNNAFGRIYMSVIKPFHFVIVRSMVKQAYKTLDRQVSVV